MLAGVQAPASSCQSPPFRAGIDSGGHLFNKAYHIFGIPKDEGQGKSLFFMKQVWQRYIFVSIFSSLGDESPALRPGSVENKDVGRGTSPCQLVLYPALKGGD